MGRARQTLSEWTASEVNRGMEKFTAKKETETKKSTQPKVKLIKKFTAKAKKRRT